MPRLSLALAASLLLAGLHAQSPIAQPGGNAQRVERVRALLKELAPATNEEYSRITSEYKERHLSEIRKVIQSGILESLGESDDPTRVAKALQSLADPDGRLPGGSTFVIRAQIAGITGIVVGYPIYYSRSAFPTTRVVIDGYRRTGSVYQLAAETGQALENCGLTLTELESPRSNEAWFLAHGQLYGDQVYHEVARIYSFDGYHFKDVWAPDAAMDHPTFKVSNGAVVIMYLGPNQATVGYHQATIEDTVGLTSGGAAVTTRVLIP